VERLDVVLFNGIMRSSKDDSCADLLADPITNLSVLPIPVGTLTFGAGAQLKNVVQYFNLCVCLSLIQCTKTLRLVLFEL
jgi:hypothetical protein